MRLSRSALEARVKKFDVRLANYADIPAIQELMAASMASILPRYLDENQVNLSSESMGVDALLIEDGTYYLVFEADVLVGCGGWSARRTLYGNSQTIGRDDSYADHKTEPAKIRAMYTHPDYLRKGIGRLLLKTGEERARAAGFTVMELGATAPGLPFYEALGYCMIEDVSRASADGTVVPVLKMRKSLIGDA